MSPRAVWFVAVGLSSVALVAPAHAGASCKPLPPVHGCPKPHGQPKEPVIKITAPTDVRARAATLHATINPEGAATQFYWAYGTSSDPNAAISSPTRTLPAGFSAKRVSTRITNLTPGVTYTVWLYANNSRGDVSRMRKAAFKTPAHPVIKVRLSSEAFVLGGEFSMLIHLRGSYNPADTPQIYLARYPYKHWVYGGNGPQYNTKTWVTPCPPRAQDDYSSSCPWLNRDFEVRVKMGSTWTQPMTIFVYPAVSLIDTRANNGASPWIDMTFTAVVHRVRHGYPTGPVYFYLGSKRKGPYRRVAVSRLRPHRGSTGAEDLIAKGRVFTHRGGYSFACTKHQLFRDMGQPYVERKCGAPRLASEPKPSKWPF
jgi:hypothetical protein